MNFDDFAPVTKAQAAAAALDPVPASAPPAVPPAPSAAVSASPVPSAAPAATPIAPLFVGRADRSRAFPLEYPLEFEGRTYTEIVVRRPNARQVGEFFEEYAAAVTADPGALVYFPVFVDAAGAPIPPAVLDALDDDDRFPIMDAVPDFLPLRLQPFREGGDLGSLPVGGASTAPTSSN